MGCSFAPNHKGMPTIAPEEELDFLRRQVLTSRNVRGGLLTDFALGGLNYQIEHHLFPSMPRGSPAPRPAPRTGLLRGARGALLRSVSDWLVSRCVDPPQRHGGSASRKRA